jgi:hypothetical protein
VPYPKECLIEGKKIPICISDPPNKPTTRVKIEPLGFQKVGHESKHLGVTWFGHFLMPFGMGICEFQHVLLHLEEQGDHPITNE